MNTLSKKEELQERLDEYEKIRSNTRLLPVKVTSFYRKKLDEEFKSLGHQEGPLHRVVYPSSDRLVIPDGVSEVDDHVEDRSHMPEPKAPFLHKYPDRILFMPTENCLGHCMYCFRQDLLEEQHESDSNTTWQPALSKLLDYLRDHPEVKEVILSGGDPFLLPAKTLDAIFSELRSAGVKYLRVHTRAIVFNPTSFSESHRKVCLEHHVRVVLHVVHPYEWCSEVSETAREWSMSGVTLNNQFPLLRNINDHHLVLANLVEKLEVDGVRTLSIYFPDPVRYSSSFRIPYLRLKKLIKDFQHTTPSWINGLRFSQDSPIGKLSPDELESIDKENCQLVYRREDKTIRVPDLPEELDQQFDLSALLWKEAPKES